MSLFCFPYFPYLTPSLLAVHLGSCPLCPLNTSIPSLIIYTPWYTGTFITDPASHWLSMWAIFSNVNLSSLPWVPWSFQLLFTELPPSSWQDKPHSLLCFWRSPLCFNSNQHETAWRWWVVWVMENAELKLWGVFQPWQAWGHAGWWGDWRCWAGRELCYFKCLQQDLKL